nr:DUF5615 family PIN-like protein [Myxacorys almedinensis]
MLFDENLSDRIVCRIIDLYPSSEHGKTLALTNTDDGIIWEYAKANDFVIVSKDSDFHQRSLLYGISVVCCMVIHRSLSIFGLAIVQHQKLFRFCETTLTR